MLSERGLTCILKFRKLLLHSFKFIFFLLCTLIQLIINQHLLIYMVNLLLLMQVNFCLPQIILQSFNFDVFYGFLFELVIRLIRKVIINSFLFCVFLFNEKIINCYFFLQLELFLVQLLSYFHLLRNFKIKTLSLFLQFIFFNLNFLVKRPFNPRLRMLK